MRAKKKTDDYGLFCFRISEKDRSALNDKLTEAKARLNRNKRPDEYVITKNQIILEALKIGLPQVKKEH